MTDPKELRPDWGVAKQLAMAASLERAREYMRKPLIDLRYLDKPQNEIGPYRATWLLGHLLFDDSIYLFNIFNDTEQIGMGVIDATFWHSIPPHVSARTWLNPLKGEIDFTGWIPIAQLRLNLDSELQVNTVWENTPVRMNNPRSFDSINKSLVVEWLAALNELTKVDSYPVRVEPGPNELPPKQRRKAAKTRKTKPWLDTRAPRVILLNPNKRYPEHGRGGSHASPMPHQRRGHWRTLQAERFGDRRGQRVWVKPAWIGPSEWSYAGNVYRVIGQRNLTC